jgi:hypothetical protein
MNRRVRPSVRTALTLVLALAFLSACATKSTIEMRRTERLPTYEALSPEQKALVDAGQIKIGMPADAVYIAWGKPAHVVESEDQNGHITSWLYYGSWMQESRYWAYRETSRHGSDLALERYLISDYQPRDFVRAQINFKDGKVLSWRTLPKPTS